MERVASRRLVSGLIRQTTTLIPGIRRAASTSSPVKASPVLSLARRNVAGKSIDPDQRRDFTDVMTKAAGDTREKVVILGSGWAGEYLCRQSR